MKLFPSGRSCLGIILRYLETNKDNYIFLNKWSPNSIISSVGHFCNISNSYKNSDLVLNHNQWGIEKRIKINKKIIIQDSCDSILLNNLSLFNDNSKFEFFSIPKIIGNLTGGLVCSNDKKFMNFCETEQKRNINFGIYQSNSKFMVAKKNYLQKTNFWHNEAFNTYCDTKTLNDIYSNLTYFEINKNTIFRRMNILKKKINLRISNRIGPVFPINLKKFKNLNIIKNNFLILNKIKNTTFNQKNPCALIPLHYRIKEKHFSKLLI